MLRLVETMSSRTRTKTSIPYAILAIAGSRSCSAFCPHPPLPLKSRTGGRPDKRSLREEMCASRDRTAVSFLAVRPPSILNRTLRTREFTSLVRPDSSGYWNTLESSEESGSTIRIQESRPSPVQIPHPELGRAHFHTFSPRPRVIPCLGRERDRVALYCHHPGHSGACARSKETGVARASQYKFKYTHLGGVERTIERDLGP